ncbi:hypothetical protein GGU11DRAFT_255785 [Lentinula aff. detonsa]|nr:hypothetical protein GGU11DRAFT_255785 [Lentinula aff. detonsa]
MPPLVCLLPSSYHWMVMPWSPFCLLLTVKIFYIETLASPESLYSCIIVAGKDKLFADPSCDRIRFSLAFS